ncbi:hypothetical protein BDR04DRAFT_848996 [Suillus decipiens]|nr:hypothetical protein BDR04DRAFT_848996 [Suillus decipiens]
MPSCQCDHRLVEFSLIRILAVIIVPFFGHLLDRLVPWTVVISTVLILVCQGVQNGAGGININITAHYLLLRIKHASPDSIYTHVQHSETARSRLNALIIISVR